MKKHSLIFCLIVCFALVFSLAACGEPTVESIAVSGQNQTCVVNQDYDTSVGTIKVTYSDGTTADVALSDSEVTVTLDNSELGEVICLVEYKGATAQYLVTIVNPTLTVTFDLNYSGAPAGSTQSVVSGERATEPAVDPERTGYAFAGWYTTSDCTTEFDFALTSITAETTIYAKWIASYTVTFDYNYDGAPQAAEVAVGEGRTVQAPQDPTRADYTFVGWFVNQAGTTAFDFATPITANVTVYAKWISANVETHVVTFDLNYTGAPQATTANVPDGESAQQPSIPTRDGGYTFAGWYTDANCTTAYDFSATVTDEITLYAAWASTYVFEAEYVDLTNKQGNGYSGTATGISMIMFNGSNASNGAHLTYLYVPGMTIDFVITSDRAVSDATIYLRLTAEAMSITITDETYTVSVNGERLEYGEIVFANIPDIAADLTPFADYLIATNVSLREGQNTISLVTANSDVMMGTMAATAPVVDCLKITTSATLTWNPHLENIPS